MWNALNMLLLGSIVTVLLAALVAAGTRPPAHIRARMWRQLLDARHARQQAEIRQQIQFRAVRTTRYWERFQAEVLAELAQSPPLPPVPAGPPGPASEVPPLYLYHGTDRRNLGSLFARGLEGRTAGRAYLALNYDFARQHAQARDRGDGLVVLRIHAQRAYQNGVRFERRGDHFALEYLHPAFVDFHWTLADLAHREGMDA